MKKSVSNEIKRGQAISFRVPSDIPDHLLKHLQKLKETERRNFSSKVAEFVMQGVGQSLSKEKEVISIPLPHKLTQVQRNWLKHEHSEALLGSIIYQLLTDPIRTASLLASLNSNSLNVDDALHLQEEVTMEKISEVELNKADDDLDAFTLESVKEDSSTIPAKEEDPSEDENEDELGNLLGDFLSEMNK